MVTPEQARELIWSRIEAEGPYRLASKAGLNASLFYQYRNGTLKLGRDSVNALRPLFPDIEPAVWLAAMGVEAVESSSIEASA